MRKKSYRSFAKRDDFIGRYMQSQSSLETPFSYDFWSAIWIMSTLLGRGVKVDRPLAPVHLNWYIILIAKSGITRKSTAVNNAKALLMEYLANYEYDTSILLPDARTTVEGLESELTTRVHAHAAINVSELVRFMGKERYTVQMPGFLTDVYDCPDARSVMLKSELTTFMHNVYITLLSASTPEWLNKAVNPEVIEGGFASRTMFVYENVRKKRVAWPSPDDTDYSELLIELDVAIKTARDMGKITLTKGARNKFTGWYNGKLQHQGAFAASFESREDAHVLKLAAMLCISDHTFQIQAHHLTTAIQLIENIKQDGMHLFDSGIIQNNEQKAINKISAQLVAASPSVVKLRSLKQNVASLMRSEQVNKLIEIMKEARMVETHQVRLGQRGVKSIVVNALPALTDEKLVEEVHKEICH